MAVSVPHTKLGEFDVSQAGKTKILGVDPHSGYLAIRRYDALCEASNAFSFQFYVDSRG